MTVEAISHHLYGGELGATRDPQRDIAFLLKEIEELRARYAALDDEFTEFVRSERG